VIKEVVLENVKSYERATLRFTEGVNAIIGENGAGKTTVLEAIGFTLFDSLPYKIGDFLRRGAKKGEIRVTFVAGDGREYIVVRKISENGTTEYYVNDLEAGRVAEGTSEVTKWVKENLGIESDLKTIFENAMGVLQGKMTSQFLESPSVRDRIFSPIIGIEGYKKAFEKSREYENYLKEKLIEIEKLIFGLEKELELKQVLQLELEEFRKKKKTLENDYGVTRFRLKEAEKRFKEIEKLKEKIDELKKKVIEKSGEINVIEDRLKNVEDNLSRLNELEKDIEGIKKDYEEYVSAEKNIKILESDEKELSARVDRLSAKRMALESIKGNIASLEKLLAEIELNEKIIEKLKSPAEKELEISQKLQKIEIVEAELKQISGQINELKEELSFKITKLEELKEKEKKYHKVKEKLKLLEDIERKREDALFMLSKLQNEYTHLKRELELLKENVCPVLNEKCDRISGKKREIEEKTRALQKKIEGLKAKIKKIDEVYEGKKKLKELGDRLKGEIKNLKEMEGEISAKRKAVERLNKKISEMNSVVAEKEKILKEYELVKGSADKLNASIAIVSQKDKKIEELEKLKNEANKIERETADFESLNEKLKQLRSKINNFKSILDEKRPLYQRYVTVTEILREKEPLEKERKNLIQKLNGKRDQLMEIEKELKARESEFDEKAYAEFKNAIINLNTTLGKIQGELKTIQENIDSRNQKLEKLSEKEKKLQDLIDKRDKISKKYRFVKDLRDIFKIAIPEITKAYVESVSFEANRIFCELMGDYSWEIRWTEDYGIKAKYRGREIDFAQMSGGEQMCAAISVRLALLNVLSGVRMAFFDEPTQNMDEERRRNLANQLSRIGGFRQIFIISHDDTFEEMVENAIKITKENGISHIS
jgi:exonuclease SbcC